MPEGAPWTQAVNLHSIRSARKAKAPPSARIARHFPRSDGEAQIGEPRKGTETIYVQQDVLNTVLFKNQNPARGRKHFF